MNGIAGIIYPDAFQVNQTINRMLACLRDPHEHSRGAFVHHNMEVACSRTVMHCNEKQTIYAGLSGFLDFPEKVKKELESLGCVFKTTSEQELLVHAYEQWGNSFLKKISGSFALFILDKQEDKILLARDPIGKKTLYWYQDQNHFLFSSQLKALLASGFVPQTPAPDALAAYLYFGYIPQDMTPIKGVSKLLPGHYLEIHGDRTMQIENYWSYSSYFKQKSTQSTKTITNTLDGMLTQSVESNIPEKGDIGCFLSGGLGSSSVAVYLSKTAPHDRVKAYTVGYKGQNDLDVLTATEVASDLNIPQKTKMITSQNILDEYPKLAWYLDEPIADITVTATWQLAKLAADESKTVMSGMGADEIFAAHERYSMDIQKRDFMDYFTQYALAPLSYALAPVVGKFYKPAAYSLLKHAHTNTWQYNYLQQNALFDMQLLEKAAPRLKGFDPEIFLSKFYKLSTIKSSTSSFLYFDVKTRLADLYILQFDKLTSAQGLRWFSPYLSKEIMEYAASLPEPDQLKGEQTGQYLKAIFKNLLPANVLNRPKQTRVNFLNDWLEEGKIMPLFKKLRGGVLVEAGLISDDWLEAQLSSPRRCHAMFRYLWAILALEVWFRLFIYRPIESTPPEISLTALMNEV